MFDEEYNSFIGITGQFPMCGNSFRLDSYKGCTYGCLYCFANARKAGGYTIKYQSSNLQTFKNSLEKALIQGKTNTLTLECLNRRVPLHLGGMSDPFQPIEWKMGISKEFIKLSNAYNYPMNISTKTSHLPEDYWKILNPEIHTFSISIIGYSDKYIKAFEKGTPSAIERIKFVRKLRARGFWVSIRIQPIIDINEVIDLIVHSDEYVNYYTVEHLKLPIDNTLVFKELAPLIKNSRLVLMGKGREYEFETKIKFENIQLIKASTKVKIGVGDNDLHTLSDSLNCCGVDCMPKAFSNWIKYNSMYIKMTGDKTQFYPKQNCHHCFYSKMQIKGNNYKDYVDRYYKNTYGTDKPKLF